MGSQEWVVGALLSQGGWALQSKRHRGKWREPGERTLPFQGRGQNSGKHLRAQAGQRQPWLDSGQVPHPTPSHPIPFPSLTVLLRSIRCLCTHCIFLSRARFSGSTTPAKPRFSSAYSCPSKAGVGWVGGWGWVGGGVGVGVGGRDGDRKQGKERLVVRS